MNDTVLDINTIEHLKSKLDFDVVELTNLSFSASDLLNYYHTVETQFQHLKWTYDMLPKEHIAEFEEYHWGFQDMFCWAIQSRIKNVNSPQLAYKMSWPEPDATDGDCFNTHTPLVFGFAKKILDNIPNVIRLVIGAHPPGSKIYNHIDDDYYIPIHIPIQTTPLSFFIVDNKEFTFEVGKAYLVNTLLPHYTHNQGDIHRIHMLFHIPIQDVHNLLSTQINL